ncbi:MAG: TetR/AcrR family transcriptional regulator [Desulfuromonadales bacterium]
MNELFSDVMSAKLTNAGITVKPASTKTGRSENTRAEIMNAAFRFLWSHPFREMTVDKLMEQTSVSRPSFYNYFVDTHELIESLLAILESDILQGANPWLSDEGDPVALLHQSLATEVLVCYRCGPFLKAVTDAAGTDARLEAGWHGMLERFDDAVIKRVVADQALGLIESFDPRTVAAALNQVNASMYVRAFGQRPRRRPEPVLDAILRLWISSLYGERWVADRMSTLQRTEGTSG